MSNSSLVNYTAISPNSSNPRNNKIKKITIHHMAGNLSVETCGRVFNGKNRQASSNYGIGSDGRVGMYVEEKNRAWTSSSPSNDNQAITIEVANDGGANTNWHVSDKALAKLIDLCVDICKRNGIASLNYTGDANGNLTRHNMFANTTCPGPYLQSKFPYIASEVNKRLNGSSTSVPSNDISSKSVDELAKEVDFFSIGTNDLTQYTLAIDRQNTELDMFYDSHHPAVLKMISMVIDNAHKAGIWAGICGELGADQSLTKEFLAMGVDELSVSPGSVLPIRKIVIETNVKDYKAKKNADKTKT